MDWMRGDVSDVMITDDQLTAALQHLLVSVEKGIERLELNGIPKPWSPSLVSNGSSSFPRCCHVNAHTVHTKDTSVQTSMPHEPDNQCHEKEQTTHDTVLTAETVQTEIVEISAAQTSYASNESIATQTSSELTSNQLPDIDKPPGELVFGLPPLAVREEDPDDGYCEHILTQPATVSQVDPDLLHSQITLLPGCRDIKGRSIVIICSDATKDDIQLSPCHLAQLFLYFHTIPKREVVSKGFLILVDASKHSEEFWNILDETFCLIEANLSNVISEVLILYKDESEKLDSTKLFPTSRVQFDILSSHQKLTCFIHKDQLLTKYGGKYAYDHQEWISFRKFLEPFINGCRLSGHHLVTLLEELRGSRLPSSSSLTHQMIEQQKRTVSLAFQDEQLRHLEEEGETILKELESYRTKSPNNHDYRENLERTNVLYDELRRALSKLSRLADKRLNRLEECLHMKTFQEESSQVLSWLCRKGSESLEKHQGIADSLAAIKQQEEEFEKFYFLAMRQIEKGNDLLEEVTTFNNDLPKIQEENLSEIIREEVGVEDLATSLKQHLGSFSDKLEGTRERIEDTAKCYQLMDKSYEWALEAMRFVSHMGINETENVDGILKQIRCLQDYLENHLSVPEDTFTEMLELATKLGNEKLLDQCKVVKRRCEETVELIQTRQATLQKVKQQMEVDSMRGPFWEAEDANQTPRTVRSLSQPINTWLPMGSSTPYSLSLACHQRRRSTGGPMNLSVSQRYGSPMGSYTSFPSSYYPSVKESCQLDSYIQEKDSGLLNRGVITEDLTSQGPIASISKTLLSSRVGYRDGHSSSSSSSLSSSSSSYTKELMMASLGEFPENDSKGVKRFHRRWQMWQMRDEALEKAKAEVREQTALLRVEKLNRLQKKNAVNSESSNSEKSRKSLSHVRSDSAHGPVPVNTHLMSQTSEVDAPNVSSVSEVSNALESKSKKTLMNVMKELIQTERDYVNSLEYIIENYIPELLREDIPQVLRGQRNVIFGNIEKIYEFHNQYFLAELEHCENNPFTVGQCFLDFQTEFYLYALYNKNKPKSDALMSEYGNTFFKKMQLKLQDKMDLASYLLKPVQRMGKYALLLKELLKECPEREAGHQALKAAEEMVRFQLRHGNDLLAMDALKDCDVNVKEQGRLLRQDEFIVWHGRLRKNMMRHIFLFEDLVLFSKAQRDPQRKGHEVYHYKQSIKTTDLGMTEKLGDSPTKFEIWFRKRKDSVTFKLQAPSPEVKSAWVSDIRKILLKQACMNKANRLAENQSMGIGNKPCLDIKPSEDQISDRSISLQQLTRAPRYRGSGNFDSRRDRNSMISVCSSSSSGSSQSSFPFIGTLNLGFEPGDSPRPLHRSLTQQSQCSTESGFCTDVSTAGDSPENELPRYHKRAERSDSLLSSDSLSTNMSPTELPSLTKLEQSLEETVTTSM